MVRKKRKVRKKKKVRKKRVRRKPRIWPVLTLITSAFTIFYVSSLLLSAGKIGKVEMLYFRNDNCQIAKTTDVLIGQATAEFGDRISVRTINAQLYPDEPEDTEEIRQLREKYNVVGLPDIIVNEKKFTKQFNRNNLFSEICNNFIDKPDVCG